MKPHLEKHAALMRLRSVEKRRRAVYSTAKLLQSQGLIGEAEVRSRIRDFWAKVAEEHEAVKKPVSRR